MPVRAWFGLTLLSFLHLLRFREQKATISHKKVASHFGNINILAYPRISVQSKTGQMRGFWAKETCFTQKHPLFPPIFPSFQPSPATKLPRRQNRNGENAAKSHKRPVKTGKKMGKIRASLGGRVLRRCADLAGFTSADAAHLP